MDEVRYLYHGTTELVARRALNTGLLPRQLHSDNTGQWESFPSNPKMVYLSETYAPFYALNAIEDSEEKLGVVEIDLHKLEGFSLYPDEDFLEQATRAMDIPDNNSSMLDELRRCKTLKERTSWWRNRLEEFPHLWKNSIDALGNCCHLGPIPAEAISRIAVYDSSSNLEMTMLMLDPTITLLNHRVCGNKYSALTGWIFGEDISVGDLMVAPSESRTTELAFLSKNRSGIDIIENPKYEK